MSRKILYFKQDGFINKHIIRELEDAGYVAVEYSEKMNKVDIAQLLSREFFYFVLSFEYLEEIYMAAIETATKYLVYLRLEQKNVYDKLCEESLVNCYYMMHEEEKENQKENRIEKLLFNEKEFNIYHTINNLYALHKNNTEPIVELKELRYVENEEITKLTDNYFRSMELERELSFQLKEQLLNYIDDLLKKKSIDSWTEIILWNRRHECWRLANGFWQFYLLQKVQAIYIEERNQYYINGEEPSVARLGSFAEMSERYFHLLLLLRRLNYNIAPEENKDIIKYILEKKISVIFIKHVVEHNKIEDKEKVYGRLEELLTKYE